MLNIINGKIRRPVKAVIYGPEGIGKSTLASGAPEPLFIDVEGGTAQMDVRRVERPETWEALIAVVKEIADTPEICRTLVIDTADWCEMLCVRYICRKYRQTSLESFGYGKGYTILQEAFSKLLEALDAVLSAGINVIVTAHAKMRKQELPDESGAFDRWEMKLTRQVAPLLKEWCDALLFLNYKTLVVTTEGNIRKAQGGRRVIYTSHHPCWDAKNRHGLPEEMDLSFENIASLFITGEEAHPEDAAPMKKMQMLLKQYSISEQELQKVVSDKGKYPAGTAPSEYDEKFISEWVLKYWDKILALIISERRKESD